MNCPPWLATELDKTGEQLAGHALTRPEAIKVIRDVILAHNDRAFMTGLAEAFAARTVDSWRRASRASGIAVPAAQSELFPELPARLFIRPGVTKPVILLTAHDWDTARNVLENRTQGAIIAAQADWASFQAAYDRIRPLLSGDLTTADVAAGLDGAFTTAV